MNFGLVNTSPGYIFVCTRVGYEKTPDHVKPERAIGKPIKGFEYSVPRSWLQKGYVQAELENNIKS